MNEAIVLLKSIVTILSNFSTIITAVTHWPGTGTPVEDGAEIARAKSILDLSARVAALEGGS